MNRVVEQCARLGGRNSLRRLVHGRNRESGVRIACPCTTTSVNIPTKSRAAETRSGLPPRNQKNFVNSAGLFENVLSECKHRWSARRAWAADCWSQTPPQRRRHWRSHHAAVEPYTPVNACALSDPAAVQGNRTVRGRVIDRHRPVIARDVPIKLVVAVEEPRRRCALGKQSQPCASYRLRQECRSSDHVRRRQWTSRI